MSSDSTFFCLGCTDRPPGAFAEYIYSRRREADEENAAESGYSSQGEDTKIPALSSFNVAQLE